MVIFVIIFLIITSIIVIIGIIDVFRQITNMKD